MAHLIKVSTVYYVDRDGKRVPPSTPGAKRVKEKSRKWYAKGVPGWPKGKKAPLAANKEVAKKMLDDLVEQAERGGAGLPVVKPSQKSLTDHLEDFEKALARGELNGKREPSPKHVALTMTRLRTLVKGCGFVTLADLNSERVNDWLSEQTRAKPVGTPPPGPEWFPIRDVAVLLGIKSKSVGTAVARLGLEARGEGKARQLSRTAVETLQAKQAQGMSAQTRSFHVTGLQMFCGWLLDKQRLTVNPLRELVRGDPKLDRRHDRRELTVEELDRLFAATLASLTAFRGLTGRDRFHLYLVAAATGFRVGELGQLVPERFRLDQDPPIVQLPRRRSKNKKGAEQTISRFVAPSLCDYFRDKRRGQPIWPGTWVDDAAEMLRADLEAAGIPYIVEGPDGPLHADFHALRHTFVTLLDRTGTSAKVAQELARHSDPKLTVGRYTHVNLAAMSEAVDRVPLPIPGLTRNTNPLAEFSRGQLEELVRTLLAVVATQGAALAPLFVPPLVPAFGTPEKCGETSGDEPHVNEGEHQERNL